MELILFVFLAGILWLVSRVYMEGRRSKRDRRRDANVAVSWSDGSRASRDDDTEPASVKVDAAHLDTRHSDSAHACQPVGSPASHGHGSDICLGHGHADVGTSDHGIGSFDHGGDFGGGHH
jgi:hypothetical protein